MEVNPDPPLDAHGLVEALDQTRAALASAHAAGFDDSDPVVVTITSAIDCIAAALDAVSRIL